MRHVSPKHKEWRFSSATRSLDHEGLKVLDVTSLAHPRFIPGATVPLTDARNTYVVRTYAYVAGGKHGLVIVNVQRPEHRSSIRHSAPRARSTICAM